MVSIQITFLKLVQKQTFKYLEPELKTIGVNSIQVDATNNHLLLNVISFSTHVSLRNIKKNFEIDNLQNFLCLGLVTSKSIEKRNILISANFSYLTIHYTVSYLATTSHRGVAAPPLLLLRI